MAEQEGLIVGADGKARCWWPGTDDVYLNYHDTEWGRPLHDDFRLFEKICLEGFQAGLSWATILHKRENFRKAFAGFDFYKVARFKESQIKRLLNDAGIVRHRKKIESTINNAKCAQAVIHEFGSLSAYLWSFEPDPQDRPTKFDRQTLLSITQSPQSVALSKDLKARGWSFVGPTTMYALMQSMGLVNDHLEGCFARAEIEAMAGK